jgi:hypothetical protein
VTLAHDPLFKIIRQIENRLNFIFEHSPNWDPGPIREYGSDSLAVDAGENERILTLDHREIGLELPQLAKYCGAIHRVLAIGFALGFRGLELAP